MVLSFSIISKHWHETGNSIHDNALFSESLQFQHKLASAEKAWLNITQEEIQKMNTCIM